MTLTRPPFVIDLMINGPTNDSGGSTELLLRSWVVVAVGWCRACPVEQSVVFLCYCLDYAIALGAAGKGPSGNRIKEYSFIIDFSRVGRPAPFKTVKACIGVIGKHCE